MDCNLMVTEVEAPQFEGATFTAADVNQVIVDTLLLANPDLREIVDAVATAIGEVIGKNPNAGQVTVDLSSLDVLDADERRIAEATLRKVFAIKGFKAGVYRTGLIVGW